MTMVNVIGLGYIGLPTALMLARSGVRVTGTDCDKKLVDSLKTGNHAFMEEGLNDLFKSAVDGGIEFTVDYVRSDTYIVAVPTPYVKISKRIDPQYVISAVNSILDVCEEGSTIIIESTVSPKTIDEYIRPEILRKGFEIGKEIHLAHAPERIIPGKMIYELEHNPRTIGADSREIGEKVRELYLKFCKAEISVTDIRSAEMSKVIENTYRDINIAFANELAKICRADDLDVYEIIRIANMHPRVDILQPGPGVGGHCISVDPWFLVGDYPDLTSLILAARKVNDSMPRHVLGRIRDIMVEHHVKDISKVGLYGLTYKEDVDDIRESPTLQLLEMMEEHLAFGVKVFDPFVKSKIVEGQIMNFDEFLDGIEILVIMVAHTHIKGRMELIKKKLILDTRNICGNEGVYKL